MFTEAEVCGSGGHALRGRGFIAQSPNRPLLKEAGPKWGGVGAMCKEGWGMVQSQNGQGGSRTPEALREEQRVWATAGVLHRFWHHRQPSQLPLSHGGVWGSQEKAGCRRGGLLLSSLIRSPRGKEDEAAHRGEKSTPGPTWMWGS